MKGECFCYNVFLLSCHSWKFFVIYYKYVVQKTIKWDFTRQHSWHIFHTPKNLTSFSRSVTKDYMLCDGKVTPCCMTFELANTEDSSGPIFHG